MGISGEVVISKNPGLPIASQSGFATKTKAVVGLQMATMISLFIHLSLSLSVTNFHYFQRKYLRREREIYHPESPKSLYMENILSSTFNSGTRRDLTISSDRILAISAIANQLQPVLNDEYCAGHWRSRPHKELLWMRSLSKGLKPRPSEYQALCGHGLQSVARLKRIFTWAACGTNSQKNYGTTASKFLTVKSNFGVKKG
jgi:hypothetical protein